MFTTEKATPQGGAISPMIMNLVLDGLETAINKKFPRWQNKKVNFIRYAGDFVITAVSQEVITKEIIPLVSGFLIDRGLELSPEKSKITHISDGFDFLSQNVRKFKGKLIIRPSKDAVQSFKDKIRKIIEENRGIPAHALIRILNPVIRDGRTITKAFAQSVFSTDWQHSFGGNSDVGLNTSTETKTVGGSIVVTSTTIILPIRELPKTVRKITGCIALATFSFGIM